MITTSIQGKFYSAGISALALALVVMVPASRAQLPVTIEQVHLYNVGNSVQYSTVGYFNLDYTPDVLDFYFNAVALDNQGQPQWIVRNLYLPDNSWIATQQSISVRFDFGLLGVNAGNPVPALNIAVAYSDSLCTKMPTFGPTQFIPVNVDTLGDDSEGEDTQVPLTIPFLSAQSFYPVFTPSDSVDAVEYRGCSVPNIDLNDSKNPDTQSYAGDKNACVPASAANSLKWLADVNSGITISDSLRAVMKELSNLMNRARNGGVAITEFIKGKLDYIQAKGLQINVKFQSKFVSGNISSSDGSTIARNDNTGEYPTWQWLKQQMDEKEDVELCYYWWDDTNNKWRGHAVVMTGIEESKSGRKVIKYKHDVRQKKAGGTKQVEDEIVVDGHGRMVLRKRGAFVGNMVAESPGAPLPVELNFFTTSTTNNDVLLTWQTSSESNNYGFELFRNDVRVAFVKGNGTTTVLHNYTYLDKKLPAGVYIYKLDQIDLDGTRKRVVSRQVTISGQPLRFELTQNYPNPFNPKTAIRYQLSADSDVHLAIFNVSGQLVRTLAQGRQHAGSYQIEWDGLDEHGWQVGAGVYLCRLRAGDRTLTRRMVLLK